MTTADAVAIDDATLARSETYGLLADALEFPSRDFHQAVQCGAFSAQVSAFVAALPYDVAAAVDFGALSEAGDYVDFQSEYIRLFDVGGVRPPCPLYGGEWGGARKHSMEEVMRFFRFFGLKVDAGTHELPDHITVELEFMKVLAHMAGLASARGMDPLPFQRAQRDFLSRQPARWWPMLQRKLAAQEPLPFYAGLASLAGAVFAADLKHLQAEIADAPRE
jgi:DMSO reductase family type II enzyme chaperone